MKYGLSFSGGKDSVLALDRSRRAGLDVAALFTIFDGDSERVRFHGTRIELIEAQAASLGVPLVRRASSPTNYEEAFLEVLDGLKSAGIEGIIFGNIHLQDIRDWYAERVLAHGFVHHEPLWGEPGTDLFTEFLDRGYVARVVSVDPSRVPSTWAGRPLDRQLLEEIASMPAVDPCGERGEYHTFVERGPLFKKPIAVRSTAPLTLDGHAMIDLMQK